MQVTHLRTSGFQSFGPAPTTIELRAVSYVLGPNGAGKTAVLEGLSRLFRTPPISAKASSHETGRYLSVARS